MFNPKKFIEMVGKGQKVAAVGRRRISFSGTDGEADSSGCTTSVANKGHFVVYSTDGRRFVVPLAYLNSTIFKELFRMSEDIFGLPCKGPITFPCDAIYMEYIVSIIQRSASQDIERALLVSISPERCSRSSVWHEGMTKQKMDLHCF